MSVGLNKCSGRGLSKIIMIPLEIHFWENLTIDQALFHCPLLNTYDYVQTDDHVYTIWT